MTTRIAILCALACLACGATARPARADGQVTFGSQWWTQSAPEARFREFREVPRGAFLESFSVVDSARGLGYSLSGANVLRRDQAERLHVTHGARAWVGLESMEVPHRLSQVAQTPYGEVRPGEWRLPDTLQAAVERNPTAFQPVMRDLLRSSHRVPLEFRTDVGEARAGFRPVRGVVVEVRGERRLRSGHRPLGAPFGFNNTIELPQPIQQRMIDADATASLVRDRFSVQATAGVSAFQNRQSSFVWDNPKSATDIVGASNAYIEGRSTSQGRLAAEPDNRVLRGQLALGLRLPMRSAFHATVGLSQIRQDEDFLPMTVNQAILAAYPVTTREGLPARSLDGKATVLTQDYRLTGRPLRRLTATLRLHDHDYDNDTRVITWPALVLMDQVFEPFPADTLNPLRNHPYGNRQTVGGVDLGVRLVPGLSLSGTAEYRRRTRTFREVERDGEAVFEVGATASPLPPLTLQASYHHGRRRIDEFHPRDYQVRTAADPDTFRFFEQPLLRRFDVADRDRDLIGAGLGWSLGTLVDVVAQYGYARDEYPDSFYGLQDALERSALAEVTLHLAPSTDLTGGYGAQQVDSRQRSQTSGATLLFLPDSAWTATLKDRNTYAFARAVWRAAPRLRLTADYALNRDRTFFDIRGLLNVTGTAPRRPAQDLPPILYRRHTAIVEARYRVRDDTDLAARYGYDQFTIRDFSTQDLPLLAVSALSPTQTAVYLGTNALSYRAHQIAVVATRRF